MQELNKFQYFLVRGVRQYLIHNFIVYLEN